MSNPTLYTTPSGLGGIFTVKILETINGDRVRVRIHMPGNPDFHGHIFVTKREKLTQQ